MSAQTTSAVQATVPDVAIRTRPPSPKRLSRKVLLAGAALAGIVVTFALLLGLSPQQHRSVTEQQAQAAAGGPPETISQAASQYDAGDFVRPASDTSSASNLAPPQDALWANASQSASVQPVAGGASQAQAEQAARDPESVARSSPILFPSANAGAADTNTRDVGDANLDARLIPPRSRYEIQSGNVIPAALVTGLNSDLPGRVIAQVTAPVFDSVTGDHLLIPQGARLIGTYNYGASHGDHRMILVWDRLIFPNGWSVNLHQMNASDPTGAAGIADTTDDHLGGLAGAVGLSSIISILANNSENDHRSDGSLAQSVGDAAAQQAAQTGSQIVQRELTVHPTLRVRPGANIRVLVVKDIELRPYR